MINNNLFVEKDSLLNPKNYSKNKHWNSNQLLRTRLFIYWLRFFLGLFYLIKIPIYYIEKNDLLLTASSMNLFGSIIDIPYSIKPFMAFIIDKIRLKYGFKKLIMIISLIDIFLIFFTYYLNLNSFIFLFFMLIHKIITTTELIIAETILILINKKIDKNNSQNNSNNLWSSFFIYKYSGILIGTFFSGRIIEIFNPKIAVLINAFISFLIFFINYFFNVKNLNLNNETNLNNNNFFGDIKIILKIFNNKKIFLLTFYLFILSCVPKFDSDFKNYFTDILNFDGNILSNIATIIIIFSLLSLNFYKNFLYKINYKKYYLIINFSLLFFNLSYLILIKRYNKNFGINDEYYTYLINGFISFFSKLKLIPILSICMDICPNNLEATTFSFFTSIFNFSKNLSLVIGSICSKIIITNKKYYENFWLLIMIQVFYYLFFIIIIFFINFPKNK